MTMYERLLHISRSNQTSLSTVLLSANKTGKTKFIGHKRRSPWNDLSSTLPNNHSYRSFSQLAGLAETVQASFPLHNIPSSSKQTATTSETTNLSLNQTSIETNLLHLNKQISDLNLGSDPLSIIRWTVEQFDGKVAMSTSFGIQSAILLHLATQVLPNIPVVWVDTGYLPKETYEYAEQLKLVLGLNLIVKSNSEWTPARMEAVHGKLWEKDDPKAHALYGKMRKVEPLQQALESIQPNPKVLLSGLRATQTKARANMEVVGYQNKRYKVLPMLRMTDEDVNKYMDMYDLPRHPLESKGYVTVGDWHSSRPLQAGEDARDTRFGGKFQECGLHVEEDEHEKQQKAGMKNKLTDYAADVEKSERNADRIQVLESFKQTQVSALETTTAHEETELAVILVKKINEDGTFCRKCNDVAAKIKTDGIERWIGYTGYADMRDSNSEGNKLARYFDIATAPFFLVRSLHDQRGNSEWKVVRSYLQMRKMLQDEADRIIDRTEKSKDLKKNEEFIEARKHILELSSHLERLRTEQNAALKKLEDTKSFFIKKFSLSGAEQLE